MPAITPNLWFDTQALEAAKFYCSVFPNSTITDVTHYTNAGPREDGTVLTVEFELDGQPYLAINGGPDFHFTEAISLSISCADQAEVDHYWNALGTAGGGDDSVCGWLKDRYGLSWQVVPQAMIALLKDPDRARANRAMAAMMQMAKLDIAALEQAADAVPAG